MYNTLDQETRRAEFRYACSSEVQCEINPQEGLGQACLILVPSIRMIMLKIKVIWSVVIVCLFKRENYELSEFDRILNQIASVLHIKFPSSGEEVLPKVALLVSLQADSQMQLVCKKQLLCSLRNRESSLWRGRSESGVCAAAATWLSHGQTPTLHALENRRKEELFPKEPSIARSPLTPMLVITYCIITLHIAYQHYSISEISASYTPTNLSLIRNVNRILSADTAFSTF